MVTMNKLRLALNLKAMGNDLDNNPKLAKIIDKYIDDNNIDVDNPQLWDMVQLYEYYKRVKKDRHRWDK